MPVLPKLNEPHSENWEPRAKGQPVPKCASSWKPTTPRAPLFSRLPLAAARTDGQTWDQHTKWGGSDNRKCHTPSLTRGSEFHKDTRELIYKTGTTSQISRSNLWSAKGKPGEGGAINYLRIDVDSLLCVKQISNKDLLYGAGDLRNIL